MAISLQEIALLIKFYQRAQHYTGGGIYGDSVIDHIDFADELRASLLLGRLKAAGFVEKRGSGEGNRSIFGITTDGEMFVDNMMDQQADIVDSAISLLSGEKISSPVPEIGEVAEETPAWSPLTIERQDPDFLKAEESLTEAATAIKSDNGYAATQPVEQAEVVTRLDAGLALMKRAPAITAEAIKTQIIWPLKKAASRFNGDTVVGAAIKLAWETFSKWAAKHGADFLDGLF